MNAAFDIVSDAVSPATTAEVIHVAEEILSTFPFDGEIVHFLNHTFILDILIEKVPLKGREMVLEVLVQHGRLGRSWSKTAGELMKINGVSKGLVEEWSTLDTPGSSSFP